MNAIDYSHLRCKLFITLDMDWACDEVLQDTYNLFCKHNISFTMNVTHTTGILHKFRENCQVELGIHPNFNNLLSPCRPTQPLTTSIFQNYKSCIADMLAIVPNAVTLRSHSLVESSQISAEMKIAGIKYDLNTFIPHDSGIVIQPFRHVNGILKLPFFYEDDIYFGYDFQYSPSDYLNSGNLLQIFNFHPIHLFLNTEKSLRYYNCKKYYHDYKHLKSFVNLGQNGCRSFLENLIDVAKHQGYSFLKISDIDSLTSI